MTKTKDALASLREAAEAATEDGTAVCIDPDDLRALLDIINLQREALGSLRDEMLEASEQDGAGGWGPFHLDAATDAADALARAQKIIEGIQ